MQKIHRTIYIVILILTLTNQLQGAILATDLTASESQSKPTLYRTARDDRYYLNRYGSSLGNSHSGHSTSTSRSLKDDRPEARNTETDTATSNINVLEKRCSRCTGYNDYPYNYRAQERGYDDRYDRYNDDRYDRYYDRSYDRYDSRYPDNRYDTRYNDRDRYDRDRWYDRRYDDRYDRYYDRYDTRGGAGADRGGYDSTRGMYDYYRGTGYDNRGYDYRKYDMRNRYPVDDYSRNWDARRGYYAERPEAAVGSYDRGGYASGWNYGRGDGYRDSW